MSLACAVAVQGQEGPEARWTGPGKRCLTLALSCSPTVEVAGVEHGGQSCKSLQTWEGFLLNLQELQQEYFQISLTFLCHRRHRAHMDLGLAACWHQAAGWQGFSPTPPHPRGVGVGIKQRLRKANKRQRVTQQARLCVCSKVGGWRFERVRGPWLWKEQRQGSRRRWGASRASWGENIYSAACVSSDPTEQNPSPMGQDV